MTSDHQKPNAAGWSDQANVKIKGSTSGWFRAKVLWSHRAWKLVVLACDGIPLPQDAVLRSDKHGQVVVMRQDERGGYEEAITGTTMEYQRERSHLSPRTQMLRESSKRIRVRRKKATLAVTNGATS